MSIAEFPFDSVDSSYPRAYDFLALPEKFKGGKTVYDDGGVDAALQYGGTGVRVWQFRHPVLTPAEAAIWDSHFASAKWMEDEGISAQTFNFKDRDTGVLYGGCRYTKYEVSHTKTWIQERVVEITRFP